MRTSLISWALEIEETNNRLKVKKKFGYPLVSFFFGQIVL